jgi:hypothetical protein
MTFNAWLGVTTQACCEYQLATRRKRDRDETPELKGRGPCTKVRFTGYNPNPHDLSEFGLRILLPSSVRLRYV